MIKRLLKSKKLVIISIIASVAIGILYFGISLYANAPQVITTKLQEGLITDYVSEVGLVEAKYSSRIATLVSGQVTEILVSVGDIVNVGDTLLDISATQVELQIKALEAQLRRVEASYNDIVSPASETLQNAKLRVNTLNSQVELAKEQLDNNQLLFNKGVISENALKDSKNSYDTAKNELDIAKNELQLLERGGSISLKQQYLSQMDEIKYNIEQLKSTKNNYHVRSPINGTVTSLSVNEGDTILTGNEIVNIMNLSELLISSEVLASKAQDIKEGSLVRIVEKDYPNKSTDLIVNKVFPTAHLSISDLGIQQKRVRLEINLPEDIETIKVGYEVDIEIITRKKDKAKFVPKEAIYSKNKNDYVMIVNGSRAREIQVETGWKTVDNVEIISGLEKGQEIIVSPPEDLKDGGFVKTIVGQ